MKINLKKTVLACAIAALAGCANEQPADAASTTAAFRDLNGNGQKDVYENASLPVEQRVADLISRLTLDQKIKLVDTDYSNGFWNLKLMFSKKQK